MRQPNGKGFAFAATIGATVIVVGMLLRFAFAIRAGDQAQLQVLTLLGVLVLGIVAWLVVWVVWYVRRRRMRRRVIAVYPTCSLIIDLFPSLSSMPTTSGLGAGELLARSRMSQLSLIVLGDRLIFMRLGASATAMDQCPLEAITNCGLTSVRSGARNLRAIHLELAAGQTSGTATLVPRTTNGAGLVPAKAAEVERLEATLRRQLDVARS